MSERPRRILLGVTGSVAAKLTPKLVAALKGLGDVQVAATRPALYFWDREETGARLWTDADEWTGDRYRQDQEIPHIALGDWADILVVAPLTANTLTKMAAGIADNLLTCACYAWPNAKPLVIAPAMNTRMWMNPITQRHLTGMRDQLHRLRVVLPVSKRLACGTTGYGAMADIADIRKAVLDSLEA